MKNSWCNECNKPKKNMIKEQSKMLKQAIEDVEESIEQWQRVINLAEETKLKAMEELKEVTRLIKKIK